LIFCSKCGSEPAFGPAGIACSDQALAELWKGLVLRGQKREGQKKKKECKGKRKEVGKGREGKGKFYKLLQKSLNPGY